MWLPGLRQFTQSRLKPIPLFSNCFTLIVAHISGTNREKWGQEKREKKEEKLEKEGWKLGNIEQNKKERRKMRNEGGKWLIYFLFFYLLLGNQWNIFEVYQNGNYHREKVKITPGKNREDWLIDFTPGKNRESGFAPSLPPKKKKFPVTPLKVSRCKGFPQKRA